MEHLNLVLTVSSWFGNVIFQREQLAQKREQYSSVSSLINLANKATTSPHEDMIIYDFLSICLATLKAKAAYYYVYLTSDEGLLAEVYEYDKILPKQERRTRRLEEARGTVTGYVAKTHKMLNIRDVALDNRFYKTDSFISHISLTSVLCMEITHANKPVGILQVTNKVNHGVFIKQDEEQFVIISTCLTHILEMIELRRIKKQNTLLTDLLGATIKRHLIPCSSCFQPLNEIFKSKENKMPTIAKSWAWVPDASNEITTVACQMLRNVITPSSLNKLDLQKLIFALDKMYAAISKETADAAFYTFHMTFCVIIRNLNMFRLTDKVALLLVAFFTPFIRLQQQLRDGHQSRPSHLAQLKNVEYHQVKTVLMFLGVCVQFPDVINRTFGEQLKRFVHIVHHKSSILHHDAPSNVVQAPPSAGASSVDLQNELEYYLKQRLEAELKSTTDVSSTANEAILKSSHFYLFLKSFNHVMNLIEDAPDILDPFYTILKEERKSNEDSNDRFEFVARFVEEVVRPQLELLVKCLPSCSPILERVETLKTEFERAATGKPKINWSLNLT